MSQYIGVPGLEAEWHEACQLAKDLGIAVQELGAVYTQLAGHAAAAHAVVHDLQRCMAFLSSRASPGAGPLPWQPQQQPCRSVSSSALTPTHTTRASQDGQGSQTRAAAGRPSPPQRVVAAGLPSRPAAGYPSALGLQRSASNGRAQPTSRVTSSSRIGSHASPGTPPLPPTPPPAFVPSPALSAQGPSPPPQAKQGSLPAPQLPLSFRRAWQQYHQAVNAGQAMLEEQLDPGADPPAGLNAPSHGLEMLVQAEAHRFIQLLGSHYATAPWPSWGTGGGEGDRLASGNLAVLKRAAQVALAALVAAQTWALQALSELSGGGAGGGTEGGPTQGAGAQSVQWVLHELSTLQQEYEGAVARLRTAEAEAVGGRGAGGSGRELISAERAEAAARWRNRFMRMALLSGTTGGAEGGGAGGQRGARGAARIGSGVLSAPSVPPLSLPRVMPQPLGVWLPPSSFIALLEAGVVPRHQGWLAELAPWASLLLPGGPTQAAQLQARWAACLAACGCAPCAPPELPCEAVGHAVQHVRGQQQLQAYAFHLWAEGQLGPALLPPTLALELASRLSQQPQGQQGSSVAGGGQSTAEARHMQLWGLGGGVGRGAEAGAGAQRTDRLLARVRLAQLLLTAHAFTHPLIIAQLEPVI